MKRLFVFLLVFVALAGAAYFALNKYYPESLAEAKTYLTELIERSESTGSDLEMVVAVNTNLDSNLTAVSKNEATGQGIAVFSEFNDGTETVTELILVGAENDHTIIKLNDRSQPTSLIYRDYLLLFDDYTRESVHLTVRKPDKTYRTFDASVADIEPVKPTLGQSRWDNLRQDGDVGFQKYVVSSVTTALDIVGCTMIESSLLPTPKAGDSLSFVGCNNDNLNTITAETSIAPCDSESVECAFSSIENLEIVVNQVEEIENTSDTPEEEEKNDDEQAADMEAAHVPSIDPSEQEEMFRMLSNIDTEGALVAAFNQTTINEQGLTEEDEGLVSISFAGDQGACKMAARSTSSGTPKAPEGEYADTELPPVSIVNTSTSTACTGMLNEETGQFELDGMMQTNTRAETGRLEGVETSGVGTFHILGLLQNGQATGTIFYANKAIDLTPQ